jgi:hypothetical protein
VKSVLCAVIIFIIGSTVVNVRAIILYQGAFAMVSLVLELDQQPLYLRTFAERLWNRGYVLTLHYGDFLRIDPYVGGAFGSSSSIHSHD